MTHRLGYLALIALSGSATPVQAKEPLLLAPSSKWHVNYAPDSCRLARSFGTGSGEVVLVFDRFQPGPMVFATFSGKPVNVRSDTRKAAIRFGPNERVQERSFATGNLENGSPALLVNGSLLVAGSDAAWEESLTGERDGESGPTKLPTIDPAWNARVTFVEIDVPGKQVLRLELGSMGKPMEALTTCTSDLLRGWGIDVAAHQSLSRPAVPAGNPGRWMNMGDYPAEMLRGGYQGIVHFRLIVDEAGKPKSCHIQKSTRPQEFEDAVCKGIMKRASFEPALDAAGKPVVSYYLNRVRFMM